jgi:hypothetical protein
LPYNASGITSAMDLLNAINAQGGGATAVRGRWNGKYYECRIGNCPNSGYITTNYNFPIYQQSGVTVAVANSINFRVNGQPYFDRATIPFPANTYVQITIPKVEDPRGVYWASDFVAKLKSIGCGDVNLDRKYPGPYSDDVWEPYQPGVNDFPIVPTAGYLVKTTNACVLYNP